MLDWRQIGMAVLGALGAALLGLLVQLFNGKAFRKLLFLPIEKLIKKTGSKEDDALLKQAEKDIGIDTVLTNPEDSDKKES